MWKGTFCVTMQRLGLLQIVGKLHVGNENALTPDSGFWTELWLEARWSLFSLVWRMQDPCFTKRILNSKFTFSTSSYYIFKELRSKEYGSVSGSFSYTTTFLQDRPLTYIFRWRSHLTDTDFWVRAVISMTESCSPARGPKDHRQYWFMDLSLAQRFLQILWMFCWYYAIYMIRTSVLQFYIAEQYSIIRKKFHSLQTQFCLQIGESLSTFASEKLCLSNMLSL